MKSPLSPTSLPEPGPSQPPDLQRLGEGLRELVAALREEGDRLEARPALHATLHAVTGPTATPEAQLAQLQAENRQLSERLEVLELQAFQRLNGSVALSQLHGLLRREEVLEAMRDILVNLVGCEQLALFEVAADGTTLQLASAHGVDAGAAEGRVAQALQSGQVWVRDDHADPDAPPHERRLSACIPLRVGPVAVGALALFGLLPHKERLDEVDRALFGQLATHGATALYCARLHEQLPPAPACPP